MSTAHAHIPVYHATLPQQGGAGTVEFAMVALPLLMAALGSIELAQWFYTRQAVSVALLDAGRAAITSHNRSDHIIAAFELALRPLFVSSSPQATEQRVVHALANRHRRMNAAPWQIEVLSPSASAFADFADAQLQVDGAVGKPSINNNYLAEQDARYRASGWANGFGPISGQTIYEANTAVLRLSWLHEPLLPLMVPLLKALGDPQGSYRQRALARGYLPMTRQMTLMMQSHPVQWADSPDGKVIYGPEIGKMAQHCSGWLCGTSTPVLPLTPTPSTELDDINRPVPPDRAPPLPQDDSKGTNAEGTTGPDVHPDLQVNENDPACGITLCCGPHADTPALHP